MADGDVSLRYRLLGHDDASPAFRSAGRSADGLHTKMTAVGVALGSMAATGILGLGRLAAGAVKTGIQTAAAMQQAQLGFATLLGSEKAAGDYMKWLTGFAASTPFELQGLVESSRTLIGVGVSAKDAKVMLQNFGDTASAIGISQDAFQRVMLATSQAISAGKFQAGDLNQIMTNGIPVWTILSKAMHKSVPELRDLASKGKLLASDVLPALQAEMHKDYGGAMAKQSQTLNGLWSTFQDTLHLGMAKVLQPLIPILQKVLPGAMATLGGWFDRGAVAASTFITTMQDTVIPGIERIASGIKDKLAPIADGIKAVAQEWGGKILAGVQTGLASGDWGPLGKTLGDGLVTAIGSMAQGAGALRGAIGNFFGSVDWMEVGKTVGKTAFPFAIGFVNTLFDGLFTAVKDHPMDVALFVVAFIPLGKLASAFGPVKGLIEKLPFGEWITKALDATAGTAWDAVIKFGKFIWDAFQAGFKDVFPGVSGFFSRLWISMSTRIGVMALDLWAKGKDMIAGLGRGIGSMVAFVVKDAMDLIASLVRPFASAGSWLIGKGAEAVTGLGRGIASEFRYVDVVVLAAMRRVVAPFANAGSFLLDAGRNIIGGLLRGIEGAVGALWARVAGIAEGIKNRIKDALKIFSPSRVMRDEVGKMIPLGIAEGMQDGASAIYNVAANLVPTTPGAYGAGSALVPASGGGTHIHLHVPNGFVGSPDQLATALSDVISRAKARGLNLSFA